MRLLGEQADLWLQLRPRTDTGLALAMLHCIIQEELYDDEFIRNWTVGFDRLMEHVREYTPEWGETVTRVPAALIRKVELYSSLMEEQKCAPLPAYTASFEDRVAPPDAATGYPYLLTTGWRLPVYRHTENRENPLLREIHPSPGILIHPDTAAKLGISEGDPVTVETQTGRATLLAFLTLGIHFDMVQATPGWQGKGNINRVIPWHRFAEGIGSVPMRGVLCRLKKGAIDSGDAEDEVLQ